MSGRTAPPKPWERRGASKVSSTTPLGPSTANDGAAKPWEQAAGTTVGPEVSTVTSRNRPWESAASTSGYNSYGSYGPNATYGSGYGSNHSAGGYGGSYGMGSSLYGRPAYGGYSSGYSGYGNTMNRFGSGYGMGGYGGGGIGSGYGMGGYGSPYGSSSFGGYGMGNYGTGGPLEGPQGGPPPPPSAWQHLLHAIGGFVHFFGRLSFLVDENAHAFHFFISSLLQLLDRAGSLYGELARFVLRLLGYRSKAKEQNPAAGRQPRGLPGLPAPPARAAAESFDSIWKDK